MAVLCSGVSCAPPDGNVPPTCEGCALWRSWGRAALLPDIFWVPPELLCFVDPTSSEMAPDAAGRLWCPCLPLPSQHVGPITGAGLRSWLFPFLVPQFPCRCWCWSLPSPLPSFCRAWRVLGCTPGAWVGGDGACPPCLVPSSLLLSTLCVGVMNYSCPVGGVCVVCLWPPA